MPDGFVIGVLVTLLVIAAFVGGAVSALHFIRTGRLEVTDAVKGAGDE
jgi:hypothetical protein